MKFYLGTHQTSWLWRTDIPLFVSRRALMQWREYKYATCSWVLDSGAFTELATYGEWTLTTQEYIELVRIFDNEIGELDWVAPMDWMCEPWIIEKTGLTVRQHQANTVDNFLELRQELGYLVAPVLQGWTIDDYHFCAELYDLAGVNLEDEKIVGVGSVCRRQASDEIAAIMRSFPSLKLHGFGVKEAGLASYQDWITSADSMAWSRKATKEPALEGCTHKHCNNCLKYASRWYQSLMDGLR